MRGALFILLLALRLQAQTVTLVWDPSPDAAALAAYRLHYGAASGSYAYSTNVGLVLTQRLTLPFPSDWYFAATAIGTNQMESDFSNEVMWRCPVGAPSLEGEPMVRLVPLLERSSNQMEWSEAFAGVPTYVAATNGAEWFRVRQMAIENVQTVMEDSQ